MSKGSSSCNEHEGLGARSGVYTRVSFYLDNILDKALKDSTTEMTCRNDSKKEICQMEIKYEFGKNI